MGQQHKLSRVSIHILISIMEAEGGIALIENKSGKDVHLNRNNRNSDPWHFVDENGKLAGEVSNLPFTIPDNTDVRLTVGQMSADCDDGPNFFARFEQGDDAPFGEVLIYCSGDKKEVTTYKFINQAGKPYL